MQLISYTDEYESMLQSLHMDTRFVPQPHLRRSALGLSPAAGVRNRFPFTPIGINPVTIAEHVYLNVDAMG